MLQHIEMKYDQSERDRWIRLDRHTFPECRRFKYCDHITGELSTKHGVTRPHYFGEAFVTRHYINQGQLVWHERYQLQKTIDDVNSIYYECNREIDDLLGVEIKQLIIREAKHLEERLRSQGERWWRFANPDVIVFDPNHRRWLFLEVKLPGDDVRINQAESLTLLASILPMSITAIVSLNPKSTR